MVTARMVYLTITGATDTLTYVIDNWGTNQYFGENIYCRMLAFIIQALINSNKYIK